MNNRKTGEIQFFTAAVIFSLLMLFVVLFQFMAISFQVNETKGNIQTALDSYCVNGGQVDYDWIKNMDVENSCYDADFENAVFQQELGWNNVGFSQWKNAGGLRVTNLSYTLTRQSREIYMTVKYDLIVPMFIRGKEVPSITVHQEVQSIYAELIGNDPHIKE